MDDFIFRVTTWNFFLSFRSRSLPSSVRIYNIINVSVSFPSFFPPNDFPRVLSCVTAFLHVSLDFLQNDFLQKKSLVLFARSA